MAQKSPPVRQLSFGGIVTEGGVTSRPPDSAVVCKDFRIMPDGDGKNFLRIRGGRESWIDGTTGSFKWIHEFRKAEFGGSVFHVVEHDGKWKRANLATQALSDIETIGTASNSNPNPGAVTNVKDKAFWTNGLGTTVGGESLPALSSWDGTQLRYVGLDPYMPSGSLTVNFTPSGGGTTKLETHLKFWVGLYNSATGHLSNGVEAGEVVNPDKETTYEGTLSISGLSNMNRSDHDAGELGELYYVVYATLDGGEVPYLLLNTAGTDIEQTQSASINLAIDANAVSGVNTQDVTKEMPTENFPPRPMRRIAYANGRIYGSLKAGGAGGTQNGFTHVVPLSEETAVVWSSAADDVEEREFVGVPEESWPLTNKKYTPNGEIPQIVAETDGNYGTVLVITYGGTFLLEETIPGVHIWRDISRTEGIWDLRTFVDTPYGAMWLTQKKEIVLLKPGDDRLTYLSRAYSSLFRSGGSANPTAAYMYDPANYIDRYQIWWGLNKCIIHDFAVGGQAYTYTNQAADSARTVQDAGGQAFHLIGIESKLYIHEVHPVTGVIPLTDEEAGGGTTEISGDWIGQWVNFGDSRLRKHLSHLSFTGDGDRSSALSGASPVTITWYKDFSNVTHVLEPEKEAQSDSDNAYGQRVSDGLGFWFKIRVQLAGHSTEGTYYLWQDDGELSPNVYGSVHQLFMTVGPESGNRA